MDFDEATKALLIFFMNQSGKNLAFADLTPEWEVTERWLLYYDTSIEPSGSNFKAGITPDTYHAMLDAYGLRELHEKLVGPPPEPVIISD